MSSNKSNKASELLQVYFDAVNAHDSKKAFEVLQNAKVDVPHGTTLHHQIEGESLKHWVEHRIDEQHATIKVTGPIKSEGEKATVEVLTQSDMIPRNIFPDGFATVVSATVGPDGKLAQVEARPKDMGEWTKLASLRDSEWRD